MKLQGKRLMMVLMMLVLIGLVGCTGAQGSAETGKQGSAETGKQGNTAQGSGETGKQGNTAQGSGETGKQGNTGTGGQAQPQPTQATVPTQAAAPTQAPASTQAPAPTRVPPTTAPPTAAPPTAAPPSAAPQTAMAEALAVTLTCPTPNALTPAQTEGPYYTANPPQRASLVEPGMGGTQMILTGFVVTPDCRPIAGARVDFWQADDKGVYDNTGYRLRGYQMTDATGRYTLETVLPGLYPGRTSHIHVKVTAPGRPTLTSQVYFPEVAANARDGIYNSQLAVRWLDSKAGKVAVFNFVVRG